MSYSVTFKAPNKATAKLKVRRELAQIVCSQPVHAADCHIAEKAACALIDGLTFDTREINVTLSGSVSSRDYTDNPELYALQHSLNIYQL